MILPLLKSLGLGGAHLRVSRYRLFEVSLGTLPKAPTARTLRWPRRASCTVVRRGSPLEIGCWRWWWQKVHDTRVGQKYATWHPRSHGGLQQGVLFLLVEERRWVVCMCRELNWFLTLSFPLIYPMGCRGDPGRTLGGAWASPLTGGYKSLGPSWNNLEDAEHMVRSTVFQNVLWPIQGGCRRTGTWERQSLLEK